MKTNVERANFGITLVLRCSSSRIAAVTNIQYSAMYDEEVTGIRGLAACRTAS